MVSHVKVTFASGNTLTLNSNGSKQELSQTTADDLTEAKKTGAMVRIEGTGSDFVVNPDHVEMVEVE